MRIHGRVTFTAEGGRCPGSVAPRLSLRAFDNTGVQRGRASWTPRPGYADYSIDSLSSGVYDLNWFVDGTLARADSFAGRIDGRGRTRVRYNINMFDC